MTQVEQDSRAFVDAHREAVARAFSDVLKERMTVEQMATVIERNNSGEYSEHACASHDFCDANEAMAEAFRRVFQREYTFDDGTNTVEADRDYSLFNSAWSLARFANFYPMKADR